MAHHTNDQHFSEEEVSKFLDNLGMTKMPRLRNDIGATGLFPNGKIAANDEGEIRIEVTNFKDIIQINFGKQVHSVGLTKQQAIDFGRYLINKAMEPERG